MLISCPYSLVKGLVIIANTFQEKNNTKRMLKRGIDKRTPLSKDKQKFSRVTDLIALFQGFSGYKAYE